ncbi:MAG: UvrD-helicase domain-containing protein [Candidatus Aminicenantes bacterium]|nr:UvrD-helicase domain-containing protein [Candidatus Aminicenantes bacterium]
MAGDGPAPPLPDSAARIPALTDHERTLLVEAGAGSGKTALMAGRAAMMVGAGVHPRDIVAITFTEAAASELLERIETMVRDLLSGTIPKELAEALPSGLTRAQKGHLVHGAKNLDEITCTTIHGFCQQLIRPYPVETDLDPGAAIIDPSAAELAYRDLLEAWLSARFGRDRGSEGLGRIPPIRDAGGTQDFLAALVLAAPEETVALAKRTAEFLKVHRTAQAAAPDLDPAVSDRFVEATSAFAAWYRNCNVEEPDTAAMIEDLLRVAEFIRGVDVPSLTGRFLKNLLFHRPPSACKKGSSEFKQWRRKTRWKQAAAAIGGSTALGERLSAAGNAHYDACGTAYEEFHSQLGALAFVRFVEEFDRLRELYREYKRDAALLDFDDLLYQARDLLKQNESVREALASRYPRILVDEFQDTDPLQAEIIWLLAGEGDPDLPWQERAIRPGALFAVGDPKQAIYRFRGADVNTYLLAKEALERRDSSSILHITANFRTRKPILEYVNAHFEPMLDESRGQPGFTPLAAIRPSAGEPCVAAIDIELDGTDRTPKGRPIARRVRRKEAKVLASVVQDLIGTYPVGDKQETLRPARAGDIALLAPTGTSLWIYEQAMEELGIPIATQAGKGFFRRQEVHDLIAIARVIADSRDTLALGALIRGPLVGLTEEEIADEIEALHARAQCADSGLGPKERSPGRLTLWTDPKAVGNGVLRRTLEVLQNLSRKARQLTPYHLMVEAVEELHVNSILKARHLRGAERALANVELVLEMARAYGSRGIGDFARALWQHWNGQDAQTEGRPDAAADAVSIITMHSAKGLEWPIVIPINSTTRPRNVTGFLYGRSDDTIHFKNKAFSSDGYAEVRDEEELELRAERIRLWYVALTRARDLLVLPRQNERIGGDWFSLIDIDLDSLPSISAGGGFGGAPEREAGSSPNAQDLATWKREAAEIHANQRQISWDRPSRHEAPVEPEEEEEAVFAGIEATLEAVPDVAQETPVQGGWTRGLILHKLIEEILTGEIQSDEAAVRARAEELIGQLGLDDEEDAAAGPSSTEMAATVMRTLQLPEVVALRPRLVPEFPVYASAVEGSAVSLTSGIADAVAIDGEGRIDVVVDWKSDVEPGRKQAAMYRRQVREYLPSTTARTGLIVFMSSGRVDRIVRDG